MLKPVAPDPELIAWLWSAEGLVWHQKNVRRVRHNVGYFADIKDDHEGCAGLLFCEVSRSSPYPDELIARELEKYGISGVPPEWKRR